MNGNIRGAGGFEKISIRHSKFAANLAELFSQSRPTVYRALGRQLTIPADSE